MPSELTKQLGEINAAVVLARTLVHAACAESKDKFRKAMDMARYSRLLAGRLGLPLLRAHRVDLAAWLSALPEGHEIRKRLASANGVDRMLSASAHPCDSLEQTIMHAVEAYQEELENSAGGALNMEALRKRIENDCASCLSDARKIYRYLVRILNEEKLIFGTAPTRGKILFVDPEEAVSPVIASLLIERGYAVQVVADAETAAKIVTDFHPDLIFCELEMPFCDGIWLCREIKKNPTTALIPFVILTSTKSRNTQRKCLLEGAEDVLTRPVDIEILFLKMKNWLAHVSVPTRVQGDDSAVTGSLADINFSDLVQLVTSAGRTMSIILRKGTETGEVSIVSGEVVHASVGNMEGESAFYALMKWKEGSFSASKKTSERRTISAPVMSLLMEGARLADEEASAQSQ